MWHFIRMIGPSSWMRREEKPLLPRTTAVMIRPAQNKHRPSAEWSTVIGSDPSGYCALIGWDDGVTTPWRHSLRYPKPPIRGISCLSPLPKWEGWLQCTERINHRRWPRKRWDGVWEVLTPFLVTSWRKMFCDVSGRINLTEGWKPASSGLKLIKYKNLYLNSKFKPVEVTVMIRSRGSWG